MRDTIDMACFGQSAQPAPVTSLQAIALGIVKGINDVKLTEQPAQCKPLTDKQSAEMWLQVTLEPCTHEAAYLRGIKDAEAAHGIKENT